MIFALNANTLKTFWNATGGRPNPLGGAPLNGKSFQVEKVHCKRVWFFARHHEVGSTLGVEKNKRKINHWILDRVQNDNV
jgi:hypothetical protein